VQALLFSDGGVLALGANIFNMSFIGTVAGWGIYRSARRFLPGMRGLVPRFIEDRRRGSRILTTACVWHHTEGAELVAAFLHGEKCAWPHATCLHGQCVEFVFGWKIRLQRLPASARDLRDHLREAVIGLRADDQIDRALGLVHARAETRGNGDAQPGGHGLVDQDNGLGLDDGDMAHFRVEGLNHGVDFDGTHHAVLRIDQARAELKSLADRMAIANADVSEGMSATLLPLWKSPHGPQGLLVGPLRILMGVCILVLLIVCANVANLLLARATVREREFTARLALGASRARLARQVLTESLLLTGTGAALGLAVTPWMSHALKFLMPPGPMQQLVSMDTRPNLSVLAFTAGVCIIAALAAGLIPALQVGRLNLTSRLNAGGRSGTAGRSRNRLRAVLVGSEVALALVTLVGAGLFARGFQTTMRIDPGFNPNNVLLSQLYLNTNGYTLAQRKEFCRRLAERMNSAPSVTDVAYSDGVPLSFEPSWWEELKIEGYAMRSNENMSIFRNVISPGYLPLMHIPIVEGRNFTEADNEDPKSPAVMIVNEAFVRRFFAGRDPIGTRIHGWGSWFRVVGVAKDSKYHYLGEPTPAYFYVPFRQIYREDMNLAFYVRTKSDPENILSTLRAQARDLDPNVTVFDAAPLKEYIGASLYPQKIAASLMTILGSIALLLAAVGLHSVMAYSVAQRTQEIGVRMALGAQPRHVLRMVIKQGLALTGGGLVAGAVLAIGLARAVASVSFSAGGMGANASLLGSGANAPLIYLCAAGFLCAIAIFATWLPARRAASIDPMQALRTE